MNAWVRTEPKTLRPFFGAESSANLLNAAKVMLKLGDEARSDDRIDLTADAMAEIAPVILPEIGGDQLLAALGEKLSYFSLVITLRTPGMLRRQLVETYPLKEGIPDEVSIPETYLEDAKLGGLCEIGLSICLTEEASLGAGWPSHLGNFLALRTFRIGLDRRQSSFRVLPLTPDIVKRERLPEGTFVYVEAEDLNDVYLDGEACATAYVAEGILSAASGSKNKAAIGALMQAEIVSAILLSEENGLADAENVTEGSPLEAILNNLIPNKKLNILELKKLASNPTRLRAAVHDGIGVVKQLEKI